MRQRITYLRHSHNDDFKPEQLRIADNSLDIRDLKALKEHRLTFGLSELPEKFHDVLEQCQDLHIRWASSIPYLPAGPLVSRIPPGLHVFYSPRVTNSSVDVLCPLLREVFDEDLKCESPQASFSALPVLSARFSSTTTSQFYALIPSIAQFALYLQQEICQFADQICQAQAFELLKSSYIDIDFDAISHEVVLSVIWDGEMDAEGWSEKIARRNGTTGEETIEVGVLNNEKPEEKEDLSLGGWLTVIGQDSEPKPTLFSFPSRHHPMPPSRSSLVYEVDFSRPTGLHPTLLIHFRKSISNFKPPLPRSQSACALHAYLTLPSQLFIDRYQFSDKLFLSSQNLVALRSLSGATDLEAPDWSVPAWGSAALYEVALPSSNKEEYGLSGELKHDYTVRIPLHARYLSPAPGGSRNVSIPWPVVFWACTAEEGSKFPVNPFDRINLGYENLFGARTMFYHVPPVRGKINAEDTPERIISMMSLPVLDLNKSKYVESGTVAAITLGVLWILWQLFKPVAAAKPKKKFEVGVPKRR